MEKVIIILGAVVLCVLIYCIFKAKDSKIFSDEWTYKREEEK